ncbi:MAG: aspartate carbamoyltransferase catalytic subunit [Corynebacterium sp.]|uniref:aspartate carbamoyltransferase catalytic subunit n=1 Tax=unclassified Corynebacterium TaxID=2624378 RepID=UPI00264791FA|nr:aspartate carbamoyltransferase catalytic subunit [Corynebacterium sp.]MDN5582689.1 aspartate carbamoyltransferase catalytic subunit [Corynebacterium sp.]MDN5718808.1 aspartate carbamoyltransferase catalytic subunit [Corynebacterium sp.]MDN6324683.1 aspartate carbamoyltransferase catalytic subunit [Corynebacterium sp.]MDN6386392.1 aspartate carbamoyltransferase catalytic subunit [Corynebacterium sp.]MDN6509560.1 aspartate carbamoyltransferase catalytic subunit [Corynebacterium sp.]
MKHLLSIADLDADDITLLLDEADRFAETLRDREVKKLPTLRGRTVFTLFYENSTRTRSSFETAGKWMSADVINISASSSSVKKGESLKDTALTLRAVGADAIIMRHPSSGAARQVANWVGQGSDGISVLNAGDGAHEHPTQALLDAVTLRNKLGTLDGAHVVIVGDILHSRVARSNALLLTALGADVTFVAPRTLLAPGIEHWVNPNGPAAGKGTVRVSHDMDTAIASADAVMMLRVQAERMDGGFFPSHREYATRYGLSQDRLAALKDDAIVLHPGPMLRGMEINDAVADAPQTVVLDQVTAGVHVRMAALFTLLVGTETNAGEQR